MVAEAAPLRKCWNDEGMSKACCMKISSHFSVARRSGAGPDEEDAQPCWPPSLLREELDIDTACCGRRPEVLVYSPPKTATKFLVQALQETTVMKIDQNHFHPLAHYEFGRMQPKPCYIITVARNLYGRNPSQYFYFASDDGVSQAGHSELRHGQSMNANFMWTGRFRNADEFRNAGVQDMYEDFRTANMLHMKHFMGDWFGWFRNVVGIDVVAEAWKNPHAQYHIFNASQHGCKCNVLLLCYEHMRYWHLAFRRFLPEAKLRREQKVNAAQDQWYSDVYRSFVKRYKYSAEESEAMCQADTMLLPFYYGRCQWDATQGRWYILPGVRPPQVPPRPKGATRLGASPAL